MTVVFDPITGQLVGHTHPASGIISGVLALSSDITPTTLAADANDWNPTSLSTSAVIRASTSANYALTGLQGGSDGRVIVIHNVGSYDLQLKADDSNSTAANRFAMRGNLRLFPGCAAILQYDATSSRWRVVGHSGAFAGDVLQIKTTTYTTTHSRAGLSGTWYDITGMSVSITPKSTASTVLVNYSVNVAVSSPGSGLIRIDRGGTSIGIANANGSRERATSRFSSEGTDNNHSVNSSSAIFQDSPNSISALTYKLQWFHDGGGPSLFLNRGPNDGNTNYSYYGQTASTISATEICQ